MLSLPKDVIDYIYKTIHNCNMNDIIHEYKSNLHVVAFSESMGYLINTHNLKEVDLQPKNRFM